MKKIKFSLVLSIVIGIILIVFSNQCFAATNNLVPSPSSNTRRYIKRYSSLVSLNSGYMRVYCNVDTNKIGVEYYDNNFQITSKKFIDMKLDIWGGFFAGSNGYYYIVEGQYNEEEDDNKEVIRITKYNSNWGEVNHCSITSNSNNFDEFWKEFAVIRYPFDAGSVEMTEINGKLYIATGHEGYVDDAVGQGHQGLSLIEVDENTLEGKIVLTNLAHSFTQYIDSKNDNLYLLELSEGDYCTSLKKIDKNTYDYSGAELLKYGGSRTSAWAVATYSSVDGIALSSNNVLSIGTSIDQSKYSSVSRSTAHNIYLAVTPMNNVNDSSSKLIWLTNYSDKTNAGPCFTGLELVKINDNKFMVCWQEYEESQDMIDNDTLSTGVLHYVFINENGNKLGKEHKVNATMSDCKPIVKNNKIVFYSSNGAIVDFYTIDCISENFSKAKTYCVAGENSTWTLDNEGVLTISGEGELSVNQKGDRIVKFPLSSTRGSYTINGSETGWTKIRSLVKKIIINEGITNVPDEKFRGFTNLTQVILPTSMKTLGIESFAYCENLRAIYILSNVNSIGKDALWSGYYSNYDDHKICYVTVYTNKGSYAEQWATNNKISCEYIDHIPFDDQVGWKLEGNTWYYYDENGNKTKDGKYKIDGKYYWFRSDGRMVTAGWYLSPKNTYSEEWYYINPGGDCVIGWKKVNNVWYYFDTEGKMYSKNSYQIDKKIYLFESSGAMVQGIGWRKLYYSTYSYDWYYLQGGGENTTCRTGWLQLKDWYYLDKTTGKMADDSQIAEGKVELFNYDGVWIDSSNKVGWFKYRGIWYYKRTKTAKISNGWEKIGKYWYYLDKDTGKMCNETKYPKYIDGKYYLFTGSGEMLTGWIKVIKTVYNYTTGKYEYNKEVWYYANSDGSLYTNKWYRNYKGSDYYFNYNGEMVSNESRYFIYNDEKRESEYYSFDSEGRCTGKVN